MKLTYHRTLSDFALNSNLRPYSKAGKLVFGGTKKEEEVKKEEPKKEEVGRRKTTLATSSVAC